MSSTVGGGEGGEGKQREKKELYYNSVYSRIIFFP